MPLFSCQKHKGLQKWHFFSCRGEASVIRALPCSTSSAPGVVRPSFIFSNAHKGVMGKKTPQWQGKQWKKMKTVRENSEKRAEKQCSVEVWNCFSSAFWKQEKEWGKKNRKEKKRKTLKKREKRAIFCKNKKKVLFLGSFEVYLLKGRGEEDWGKFYMCIFRWETCTDIPWVRGWSVCMR